MSTLTVINKFTDLITFEQRCAILSASGHSAEACRQSYLINSRSADSRHVRSVSAIAHGETGPSCERSSYISTTYHTLSWFLSPSVRPSANPSVKRVCNEFSVAPTSDRCACYSVTLAVHFCCGRQRAYVAYGRAFARFAPPCLYECWTCSVEAPENRLEACWSAAWYR